MTSRRIVFSLISGLLLVAAFPTIELPMFAWVALVPLLLALKEQTVKTGFWLGGISGLVFFCGTVYWVTNSVHFYGYIPLVPAALITLLLCAYLALYPAIFGAAVVSLRRKHPSLVIIVIPALWTTLELARTYVFSGFPWSLLGYSQYTVLPAIQIADLVGVYGISFLIVLVNTAISEFLTDRRKYTGLIIAITMIACVVVYGYVKLDVPDGTGKLKVSVIQGNIEQDKKWDPTYQAEVSSTYKRLTMEVLKQKPDIIIWPETATPFYFGGFGDNGRLTQDLKNFVKMNKVPLLTGSPTYEVKPQRTVILKNSVFLLANNGEVDAVYHKLHLVPFGEYVPLKSVLFFVEKMVQAIGDFQAGKDYTVMTAHPHGQEGAIKFSTVICYEIVFPDLVRRFVDRGANVLTTITNDAWFGRTGAPYQHFSMAVFRAVENRVPVARAANTGISGFIDAKGRILETSPIFSEAHLTRSITPGITKTFYTKYGDVFAYLCVIFIVILLVWKTKKPV